MLEFTFNIYVQQVITQETINFSYFGPWTNSNIYKGTYRNYVREYVNNGGIFFYQGETT